ncbi:MAG: serine/threonine protein kinase, partial [Planctomycetes bacterium]|nr:serine/threonine protein kinase [Planctomycetota bacterium]
MGSTVNGPFRRGTVLDRRYKLEELINIGGEAFVHRARDKKTGDTVVVRQYQRGDAESRQRWQRECYIRVKSEHVAEHLGGGESKGSLYVVVAYVDGRSLEAIIEEQGTYLPQADVIDFTRQIAQGLADMHDVRLVHRDLKSANVVVDRSKQAKIVDFGLVRPWHGQTIANDGMARGTLHFMSPEHLSDPQAVDHRSDLYGMGAVMYQMATGTLPFDGASEMDIKEKILHEAPVKPSVLTPGLDSDL